MGAEHGERRAPGSASGGEPGGRVLDHEAVRRGHAEGSGAAQVGLGVGLAARDVVRGHDVRGAGDPRRPEPLGRELPRGGRDDRGPRVAQGGEGVGGARDRGDAVLVLELELGDAGGRCLDLVGRDQALHGLPRRDPVRDGEVVGAGHVVLGGPPPPAALDGRDRVHEGPVEVEEHGGERAAGERAERDGTGVLGRGGRGLVHGHGTSLRNVGTSSGSVVQCAP
ncbi:hypothetical protein GCM10025865_07440 [Paraoerskovia sediminicola]|uniref:Uncharacterized protein n=1 Tax=Paraoerskovia sediminicola TaxID=1138587 RepID=A0ABM8G058_9CELL|nr:hypothetical protein GCM10025865_07440 [Paraoerskovia sediminicola]